MHPKEKKQKRIDEVRALLEEFSNQYLPSDLSLYIFKLWEQIGRKRKYIITSGQKENWASAVVYVIARLNFLFDKDSPNYLAPDTICEFFGTKKTTAAARASEIEKACRIRMGQEGLCRPEISDSLTFVQLPGGIVLTKEMAKKMGIM